MKKIRNKKRLIILTKKRFRKKLIRKRIRKLLREHPEFKKARKINRLERKTRKKQFINISPPSNFSIKNNPDETLTYFKKVNKHLLDYEPVYIDMIAIEQLTVDALIYHLAVNQRLKLICSDYYLEGSFPEETKVRQLMQKSGFLRYVLTRNENIQSDNNCIEIQSGQEAKNDIVKKICHFVQKKFDVSRVATRPLYNIIFEMMLNTRHHAYNTNDRGYSHWMLFSRFRPNKDTMEFVFMDTGHGIPSTVRKNKIELVQKWFAGMHMTDFSESDLLKSALDGAYRTRTGEGYRGRGLPEIYKFYKRGYIKDLNIISNKACLMFNDHYVGKDLTTELMGTLFFWKITKESIYEKN